MPRPNLHHFGGYCKCAKLVSRRVLVAAAALTFAAGCSNNPTSFTPGQSSSLSPSSQRIVAGMRVLPGPAVAGPIIVPLVPRDVNAPRGWPVEPARHHRHPQLLFVADSSSGVLIYNPATVNGSPTGSITNGVNAPAQLAVDKASTLYVVNDGNNTITVYAKGSKTPKLTISSGLSGPYGVTVDSSGEVFASNLNTNTVVGYKAGQTSPFESIDFSSLGQPVGLGVDSMRQYLGRVRLDQRRFRNSQRIVDSEERRTCPASTDRSGSHSVEAI